MNADAQRVADQLVAAAVPVNLDAPGEYQNQIELARTMEAFIVAMPLEEMVERADDQCGLSFLGSDLSASRELRRTRSVLTILRFAKKEIQKIRARNGG